MDILEKWKKWKLYIDLFYAVSRFRGCQDPVCLWAIRRRRGIGEERGAVQRGERKCGARFPPHVSLSVIVRGKAVQYGLQFVSLQVGLLYVSQFALCYKGIYSQPF